MCLLNSRHEHRRELERRSALALSCTQSAAADSVRNNLVGLGTSLPPGHRLRVAVDVDEGGGSRCSWSPAAVSHRSSHLTFAPSCCDAVLGRFVWTLNRFCKEAYDMDHGVHDYWVYEFAKVRPFRWSQQPQQPCWHVLPVQPMATASMSCQQKADILQCVVLHCPCLFAQLLLLPPGHAATTRPAAVVVACCRPADLELLSGALQ